MAPIANLPCRPVFVANLVPNEVSSFQKRQLPSFFNLALNVYDLCQIPRIFQRERLEKTSSSSPQRGRCSRMAGEYRHDSDRHSMFFLHQALTYKQEPVDSVISLLHYLLFNFHITN